MIRRVVHSSPVLARVGLSRDAPGAPSFSRFLREGGPLGWEFQRCRVPHSSPLLAEWDFPGTCGCPILLAFFARGWAPRVSISTLPGDLFTPALGLRLDVYRIHCCVLI